MIRNYFFGLHFIRIKTVNLTLRHREIKFGFVYTFFRSETSSDGSESGDTARSVMKCIGRQPNSEVLKCYLTRVAISSVGEPTEKDDQEFKFILTLLNNWPWEH